MNIYELAQSLAEVKMEDFNEIRARLFLLNPDAATAEAFDRAIDSGSIMRDAVCPVLDVNGNPLVIGNIYLYEKFHNSVKIKIREYAFGSGNLLDRYYRVFYTDDQLNDSFLVVEARFPNGVFGGAVYPSKLVPILSSKELRPSGLCVDEFTVPDDFDAVLPEEILSAFEGE